jgi:hypothetical protein
MSGVRLAQHRNAATHFLLGTTSRAPALDLPSAFREARSRLHGPTAPGYQLFAVSGDGSVRSVFVGTGPEGFVIVGRHTKCDLQVDSEEISLRHLLVRAVITESGEFALRLLDLQTPTSFRLTDGTLASSALLQGPAAFTAGTCSFFAVPYGLALGAELPSTDVVRANRVPALRMRTSRDDGSLGRSTFWRCHVYTLPSPPPEDEPCEGEGRKVHLLLESAAASTSVHRTEAQLQRGVLVGRYSRCSVVAPGGSDVSRVHVCLLAEGGRFHVFDTASTYGTSRRATALRHVTLEDNDEIDLAPGHNQAVLLRWQVEA